MLEELWAANLPMPRTWSADKMEQAMGKRNAFGPCSSHNAWFVLVAEGMDISWDLEQDATPCGCWRRVLWAHSGKSPPHAAVYTLGLAGMSGRDAATPCKKRNTARVENAIQARREVVAAQQCKERLQSVAGRTCQRGWASGSSRERSATGQAGPFGRAVRWNTALAM